MVINRYIKLVIIFLLLSSSGCSQTTNTNKEKRDIYDPVSGIIDLFDTYDVVAFGEYHDSPKIFSLYNELINNQSFREKVDIIVFEVANSIHQNLIDRYVDGANVSIEELSKVWRDASNSGSQIGDPQLFIDFFKAIREVNKSSPPEERLKVLAGDPPIDWSHVKTREDLSPFMEDRDRHYGELVFNEVLAKNKRAFLIMGAGHFYPSTYSSSEYCITKKIKDIYPNKVYVVNVRVDKQLFDMGYPEPSMLPVSIPEVGNMSVSDLNPLVKLKAEIDAIIFMGELVKEIPAPFDRANPYYEEFLRRKKIGAENPFYGIKNDQLILDNESAEKKLKEKLFDIAAHALEDYNSRLGANTNAKYNEFVIPESFYGDGFNFSIIKNEEDPSRLNLVGEWNPNNSQDPKISIIVTISKADDFAIIKVERHIE